MMTAVRIEEVHGDNTFPMRLPRAATLHAGMTEKSGADLLKECVYGEAGFEEDCSKALSV